MANIIDFLMTAYNFLNGIVIPIGEYSFTFATILRTEMLVFIALEIVDAFWHFGSLATVLRDTVN